MRLHILSDLHLEFTPFELPKAEADVVILAGDIHPGLAGLKWIQENIRDLPVIYVLGNHEFYGKDIPKLTLELKERARGTNVYVMENDKVEIGGVTFLGATLWTDFELDGDPASSQAEAAFQLTDYRRIRVEPQYSKFRPRDSRRLHLETLTWLREQVATQTESPKIVVTHHAPSRRSIKPKKQNHPLNPAYASNLDSLIESSNARLWIHGHIHYASDYTIGTTRVLTNPRGYPDEPVAGFNPALVIDV